MSRAWRVSYVHHAVVKNQETGELIKLTSETFKEPFAVFSDTSEEAAEEVLTEIDCTTLFDCGSDVFKPYEKHELVSLSQEITEVKRDTFAEMLRSTSTKEVPVKADPGAEQFEWQIKYKCSADVTRYATKGSEGKTVTYKGKQQDHHDTILASSKEEAEEKFNEYASNQLEERLDSLLHDKVHAATGEDKGELVCWYTSVTKVTKV